MLQGQSEEKPRHLYSELGTGLVSFWNMPCALCVHEQANYVENIGRQNEIPVI